MQKGEIFTMLRRYRIKSAPRFVFFLTLCTLFLLFAATSLTGRNSAEGLSETEYRQIEVCAGDTLWEIASEYGPDDVDIRRTIHEICSVNDTQADRLREGDLLLIPVRL